LTDNHELLFLFIKLYVFPSGLFIAIAAGVTFYASSIPSEAKTTLIVAFLTASSILFGFATSSLIRFSDKIQDLNQKTSDVAEEFCVLYRMAETDEKLSSKILSYKTKVHNFGMKSGYGYTGEALITIESAYNFLLQDFRWWVNLYQKIIYLLHITGLFALVASIIFSLLSYAPQLMESTLFGAIMSFMLSIPIILFEWLVSYKWLISLTDTLFNIRQQIIGGITGILPQEYRREFTYSRGLRESL